MASIVAIQVALGCSSLPTPTPPASTPRPVASGVTAADARLMPAMLDIARHPDWAPGSTADLNAHRAVAGVDELCVEVGRPDLLPLYVTLGIDVIPWSVRSIVVFDPAADSEPRETYNSGDRVSDPELCSALLRASGEAFTSDPTTVEVNGPIQNPIHALAIAEAIVQTPETFGIDRSLQPSINLLSVIQQPNPDERQCYYGVIYQGGPRARVTLTLVRDGDGDAWRVGHMRINQQALHTPPPRPAEAC
jgi:hypothetical protein